MKIGSVKADMVHDSLDDSKKPPSSDVLNWHVHFCSYFGHFSKGFLREHNFNSFYQQYKEILKYEELE